MSLQMAYFHSFLWLSNIPLHMCTTPRSPALQVDSLPPEPPGKLSTFHCIYVPPPVYPFLYCFQTLAIVNCAVVNIGAHVNFKIFIYLFLGGLGIHCCMWTFSGSREQGLLFLGVHCGAFSLRNLGSRVRSQYLWLICSVACGTFPNQGWNPCLLH